MAEDMHIKSGRIRMQMISTGYSGSQWLKFFAENKYKISKEAEEAITGSDYQNNHCMGIGELHKTVLVRGDEFKNYFNALTASNIISHTRREFGEIAFSNIKAELALLCREQFTYTDHQLNDVNCIVVLHKPIIHPEYGEGYLACYGLNEGLWIDVIYKKISQKFDDKTAFLFIEE